MHCTRIHSFTQKGVYPLQSLATSALLLSRTKVDVQFGPFLVRSLSTLVLSTDLDIHFGPYIATFLQPGSMPSAWAERNSSGLTEVTTDTTDRNDRPVAVGGIGNLVFPWLWCWSGGWSLGRGLAPSPDYRNKLFVPTQHPIFTPGHDNRLCNYYHELLHYRIKIMSYLCYKHLLSAVWKECTKAWHPTKPRARSKIFTPVDFVNGVSSYGVCH